MRVTVRSITAKVLERLGHTEDDIRYLVSFIPVCPDRPGIRFPELTEEEEYGVVVRALDGKMGIEKFDAVLRGDRNWKEI